MFQRTALSLLLLALVSCKNDTNTYEKIKDSQWLLGKWTSQSQNGILEETWKSLNDSTLSGTSYFIKGKDTLHNELIVLQQNSDNLLYKATITGENNGKTIVFPLTSSTEKSLHFENPKHDYPQKIDYEYANANTLITKISGVQAGKLASETYTMKKSK